MLRLVHDHLHGAPAALLRALVLGQAAPRAPLLGRRQAVGQAGELREVLRLSAVEGRPPRHRQAPGRLRLRTLRVRRVLADQGEAGAGAGVPGTSVAADLNCEREIHKYHL